MNLSELYEWRVDNELEIAKVTSVEFNEVHEGCDEFRHSSLVQQNSDASVQYDFKLNTLDYFKRVSSWIFDRYD
jgi:hypothetical protein